MNYDVTLYGVTGTKVDHRNVVKGEMLDRVRYAMESEFISEVRVTKSVETLLSPVNS